MLPETLPYVPFKVVPMHKPEGRYMLLDARTGKVIADGNGYGYKTYEGATKVGRYLFNGCKPYIDASKKN